MNRGKDSGLFDEVVRVLHAQRKPVPSERADKCPRLLGTEENGDVYILREAQRPVQYRRLGPEDVPGNAERTERLIEPPIDFNVWRCHRRFDGACWRGRCGGPDLAAWSPPTILPDAGAGTVHEGHRALRGTRPGPLRDNALPGLPVSARPRGPIGAARTHESS